MDTLLEFLISTKFVIVYCVAIFIVFIGFIIWLAYQV